MIGRTLSHYRILEKIGEGAMGVIYKAWDEKLGRIVALKLLPPYISSASAEMMRLARQRFIQEAKAASALDHPQVGTIYEIAETEGGETFIAMAYYEGESLEQKISRGPLELDEAITITRQVAQALVKVHENGIVHRDIKPANILVTTEGSVKLIDFGLAKLADTTRITKRGTTVGTLTYMSPEQASGDEVDERTDLWSLGVVLFEMLTGQPAFRGDNDRVVLHNILNEEPLSTRFRPKDILPALDPILRRALAKDRTQRYQSAGELLVDLREQGKGGSLSKTGRTKSRSSIAVLPFTNMSADPEQEYFCDGMTEEIINALTHVKTLHVVARTSAFAFKGTKTDIREIGQKLGVDTILDGSVRKSGNRLRITARLVIVADGYHLWSDRYDRELKDIFDIQDEIALAIVENLEVELLRGDKDALLRRYTDDLELHNLYLLGRYHWSRWTESDLKKSIACYEEAIVADPDYAPAHAGLAIVYVILGGAGVPKLLPKEAIPRSRALAQRALAVDPNNGEALGALAVVKGWFERNWQEAEVLAKRATDVDPNNPVSHGSYAHCLTPLGRHEEAIRQIAWANALDPLAPNHYRNAAFHHYFARRYDEALEFCDRCLELFPDYPLTHGAKGTVFLQQGRYDNAIRELETEPPIYRDGLLGLAYGASGRLADARRILEELESRKKVEFIEPSVALVHLGLGEYDDAIRFLQEAARVPLPESSRLLYAYPLPWLKVDPIFDPLRDDRRFRDLLKQMNFPE